MNTKLLLIKIGITPNLKGFAVMEWALNHPEYSGYSIFTEYAKVVDTTPLNIERRLRNAILHVHPEYMHKIIMGNKPTASVFIECLRVVIENGILSEEA